MSMSMSERTHDDDGKVRRLGVWVFFFFLGSVLGMLDIPCSTTVEEVYCI